MSPCNSTGAIASEPSTASDLCDANLTSKAPAGGTGGRSYGERAVAPARLPAMYNDPVRPAASVNISVPAPSGGPDGHAATKQAGGPPVSSADVLAVNTERIMAPGEEAFTQYPLPGSSVEEAEYPASNP